MFKPRIVSLSLSLSNARLYTPTHNLACMMVLSQFISLYLEMNSFIIITENITICFEFLPFIFNNSGVFEGIIIHSMCITWHLGKHTAPNPISIITVINLRLQHFFPTICVSFKSVVIDIYYNKWTNVNLSSYDVNWAIFPPGSRNFFSFCFASALQHLLIIDFLWC